MRNFLQTILVIFPALLFSASLFAQEVKMADEMRENGKIYVVVAVCLTILVGLFLYVFKLDRKITKLEKQLKVES